MEGNLNNRWIWKGGGIVEDNEHAGKGGEVGPGSFLEKISEGDEEEVTLMVVGGKGYLSWYQGVGRVDTGEQSGREGEE